MMQKKWKCKFLSLILCVSLIVSNLSIPAHAAGNGQVLQENGETTEVSVENSSAEMLEQEMEIVTEQKEREMELSSVSSNNIPDIKLYVDKIYGGKIPTLDISYTGDMQFGEFFYGQSFSVEFIGGTTEDSSTWEELDYSTANFYDSSVTLAPLSFYNLNPGEYYGKLVFYIAEEDELSDEYIRVFEQEVPLGEGRTLNVTDSFGSFEDVEITLQGMKVAVAGTFRYLDYQTEENLTIDLVQYDGTGKEVYRDKVMQQNGYMGIGSHSLGFANGSRLSHADAVLFQLEATNKDGVVIYSESFTRPNPQIEFSVTETELFKDQHVQFMVTYTGNMFEDASLEEVFQVVLNGGTTANKEEWQEIDQTSVYYNAQTTSNYVNMSGFKPLTTYYGELIIYLEHYDSYMNEFVRVLERVIPVNFTTVDVEKVYNLEHEFPDEVLRNEIITNLRNLGYYNENGTVTESALETIQQLYVNRYDFSKPAIKDMTGIDLLTGLTDLQFANHEVTDISKIDWSKLTKLSKIWANANEITKLPDLSKNTALQSVFFRENKLSQEEVAKAKDKFPEGFTDYILINQRVNGFEIVAEDNYYYYGSTVNLYIQAKGYKSDLPYRMKFYIDGTEQNFENDWMNQQKWLYKLKGANLTEGEHTLKVELCKIYRDENNVETLEVEETINHSFTVIRQDVFLEKTPYYIGSDNIEHSYMNFDIYYPVGKEVVKAEMIKEGKIYGKTNQEEDKIYSFVASGDPRYALLNHLDSMKSESNLYQSNVSLDFVYNKAPVGNYDLKVTFADNSTYVVKDGIIVSADCENIIIDCNLGYNYDHTGKYLYVSLTGWNLNPAKLNYTISQNGKTYPVSYVNYRPTYSGAIVKLEKVGWTVSEEGYFNIYISGEGKQSEIAGYGHPDSGIYYLDYNKVTGKIEVAFTEDTNVNGKTVMVSVKDGDKTDGEVIATGSAKITDGIGYFDIKDAGGLSFPSYPGYFELEFMVDSQIIHTYYFHIDDYELGIRTVNQWSYVSSLYEGTDSPVMWYYSEMEYNSDNTDAASYSAQITGENLASPIVITSFDNKVKTDKVYNQVAIGMDFDESSLKAGVYTITLFKNDKEVSNRELTVKSAEKFIVSYISPSWESEKEIKVYLALNNPKDTDQYTVTITDVDGNKVDGLKTTITSRYSSGVELSVTGLNYEDAKREYYVKVVHNTLGEPYDSQGNPFYLNENGKLETISYSIFNSYMVQSPDEERLVGIGLSRAAFPVIFRVYRPYQTEPVFETVVEQSQMGNSNFYLFTKEMYDNLPDKNGLYDIVCIDANKRVGGFSGYNISYYNTIKWTYTLDKSTLYINDEQNRTATLVLEGNKGTPTFTSLDTNVITVKADEQNPNKAIITAVGVGRAGVQIIVDGSIANVWFQVTRKADVTALELNTTEMLLGVGEEQKLVASVLPAEAWTEDLEFTFSVASADGKQDEVICIEKGETPDTAWIHAKGIGEAIVAVSVKDSVKGTEYTAQCKITVKNVFSKEEQKDITEKAGMQYVLLNNYSEMKATLAEVEPKLKTGWSWVDNTIILTADNDAPIQYYVAEYKEDGFESFKAFLPVAVSQLTAVEIVGENTIVKEETKTYSVIGKYKGYQPIADEYAGSFQYQWSVADKEPVVVLTNDTLKNVDITAKTVENKITQTVNLEVSVKGNEFKSSMKINVIPKPYVDDIQIKASTEQLVTAILGALEWKDEITQLVLNEKDFKSIKDEVHNTLRMDAAAFTRGVETTLEKGFKWSVSDTSVMTVKAEKDSTSAVLTFKKAGSAVLYVAAQDDGKYEHEILVTVKDYTPVLESNKITLDMYAKNGSILPVRSQNESIITGIEICEQDLASKEWKTSDKFTVENREDGFYVKASNTYRPAKNENVKVQLKITTDNMINGNKVTEVTEKPATINVNVKTKPTVSLKVLSKANLFYTDAIAKYQLSSKYEIESIQDITVKEQDTYRGRREEKGFRLKEADITNHEIMLDVGDTLSPTTLKEFKKDKELRKVTLKVSFKGYTDAADQTIVLNVATEDKKLSLKLNDVALLQGIRSSVTQVYDTKAKSAYALDESAEITSKTNNLNLNVTKDGNVAIIYDGNKNVSYKGELTSKLWTQTLNIAGKVTVNVPYRQELVLENNKITLNKGYNIQNNGKLEIPVYVKNNSVQIEYINYHIDNLNRALFDNGYLYLTFSQAEQKLYLGLNKGMGDKVDAGTYKVNLTAGVKLTNGEYNSLKTVPLTITITDQTPEVSLKAKGSIDLVRRQGTAIVYTPSIKNVTAKVEEVSLSGGYAEYFEAKVQDGTVVVNAAPNCAMSTKISYPVTINLTLDNGCQVSASVKIKPGNKLPKLTAMVTKATLYKIASQELEFEVVTKDSATSVGRIERVTDKNSKYFEFTTVGNIITVSLSDEADKMKPGKYTISYKVYMEGAAYNVKPTTLKLTVTVK